jgi:hypothetical protein
MDLTRGSGDKLSEELLEWLARRRPLRRGRGLKHLFKCILLLLYLNLLI